MKRIKDYAYLQMAYGLAEKARGWTSPNPYVGVIIVKRNKIIGYGYHERPGKPHAETNALRMAGSESRNGTAYLTLEPCVHWGRTPPCVEGIIQSGLKRVVVSALDPNPMVYRKGIQKMKMAGIEVSLGLLSEKNCRMNETYIKYITKKIPYVVIKAASSLDGRIATKTNESTWISSVLTREYIHLLRGEFDAIMVGINTIIRDDPLLTVRHLHWRGKKIIRIICDSQLRLPMKARIIKTLSKGRIIIFTTESAAKKKIDELRKKGLEIIISPSSGSRLNLEKILQHIGQLGITSILVEGGGLLITSFLEEKLADKIFLTISPILIGGEQASSFFEGKGVEKIADAMNLKKTTSFQIDKDIIIKGYF